MTALLRLAAADRSGRHLLRTALAAAAAIGCGGLALLVATHGGTC